MLKLSAFAITCVLTGLTGFVIWRSTSGSAPIDASNTDSMNAGSIAPPTDAVNSSDAIGLRTSLGSGSSTQIASRTDPPRGKPVAKRSKQDSACLKRGTARCDQMLSRVSVAAAQCSQALRQRQYANDQEHGVLRQGGIYGGMSCGRDSGFYYPRCIADARTACGFRSQMTDVDLKIEKLRRMGAK